MTYNTVIYGRLLADTVPGVIGDEKEYGRIESIFNGLIDKGEETLSPEESRLFELLAKLLEEFEADALEPLSDVSPADALRFLMDQNDLKQADLEDVFGTQSAVSRAISGSRSISKIQAKRLAQRFKVSAELFI